MAGGAAALLAGCGDDGGSKAPVEDSGALVTKSEDATSRAVAGGTWPTFITTEGLSLDHLSAPRTASTQADMTYSRFVRYKTGSREKPPTAEVEGEAAASWELTPDGTQLTFKLRPNLGLDPRAPTNGRNVDSADAAFSWEKFSQQGAQAGDYSNARNADAPVTSVQTPDKNTVVFKLAFPFAPLLSLFGFSRGLVIMPVESGSAFDPRGDIRGSGPWMMTKYTPSVGYEFKKNPNYYRKDRPFLDGVNRTLITEYAQRLAQFKAGNLWNVDARGEDIAGLKRDDPRINIYSTGFGVSVSMLGFSQQPGSPFEDVRVRRALSMLLDRELWIDAVYNVSVLAKDGIKLKTRWHSHYASGWEKYWSDPQGGDLGEGARYFKHDPEEAKKLLQAAGVSTLKFPATVNAADPTRQLEVITQMWREGGLTVDTKPLPNAEWTQVCHTGGGKWEGVCAVPDGPGADIDVSFSTRVRAGASQYVMFPKPIDKIDDLIKKSRFELDDEKRTKLIKVDIQREMASQMPYLNYLGQAEGLNTAWPWFENYGFTQGQTGGSAGQEAYLDYWFDAKKKPS